MVRQGFSRVDIGWLKEISEEYKIEYEWLCRLYSLHNYNKERVLTILKEEFRAESIDELPKIVVFSNGMLLKDRFYSFDDRNNQELARMLEKNEFDRDTFENVFGISGRSADIVVERRSQDYDPMDMSDIRTNLENQSKRRKFSAKDADSKLSCLKLVIGKGIVETSEINQINGDLQNQIEHNKNTLESTNNKESDQLQKELIFGENPSIKFKLFYKNSEYTVKADSNLKIATVIYFFAEKYNSKVYLSMNDEILDENEQIGILKNTMVDVIEMRS